MGIIAKAFVAVLLLSQFGIPIHQQLDVRNGLFDVVRPSDTNNILVHGRIGRHIDVDVIVSANVFDFTATGTNDTMKEFLWNVDFLVDEPRMGDFVVMVVAQIPDDLLGRLDVLRTVSSDSDTGRRCDISDLQ